MLHRTIIKNMMFSRTTSAQHTALNFVRKLFDKNNTEPKPSIEVAQLYGHYLKNLKEYSVCLHDI